MAGAIISPLVIALVSIGVAGFQFLKSDIRDGEARLSQQIEVVKLDLKAGSVATETGLRKDLKNLRGC